MKLKNKRVLITAGPTWVPIDEVRVISNIATGETGTLLAEKLQNLGAKVTLLLGPAESCCLNKKIKLIRFKFFDELKDRLLKELRSKKYDIVIHSAAVADFAPAARLEGKIDSDKSHNLKLLPLPKIIRDMRRLAAKAKLIMFKLEAGVSMDTLIRRAKIAGRKAGADLVVANTLRPYRAFIIDMTGNSVPVKNKTELVTQLTKLLVRCY